MKKVLTALFFLAIVSLTAQTTLPTSWSFTNATYPNGWTNSGTAFYTGSGNTPPACKFDGTGDWVQIYFAGAPGALSYYITGNSFSGGTFDVEESVNGSTWTTLHSYTTNMPSAYTLMTDNPSATSHYVRFIYTQKQSGNVGLDDVNLAAAPAGPQQEINVLYGSNTVLSGGSAWFSSPVSTTTPITFTVENNGTSNTLNISSAVISGPNAADFAVGSVPSTVNAQSNAPLVINFTPAVAGTRVATLTINNDDADESAYVINLYGVGGSYATEPTASATNMTFSSVKSYRFKVNWTGASTTPDGYIVLRRDDAPVTDIPADGSAYAVGDQVGNSKVAYIGSGSSFWPNYIGASQDYFFAVYSWNGPAPYTNYYGAAPLTGSVIASGSMQPSTYYNTISTAAPTFVSDLTALTNPHTDNFYSNYGARMVSLFWARDTTGGDKAITCVYSGENYVYTEPFAWTYFSREHSYCHSWMPTYPSTTGPEYSDYFNLFPVNQNDANAIRSNYPLGEVVTASYTYLGCRYGQDANGHTVFEPRDEQKGDAARAIFYMAMCYNTSSQNWGFPNPISSSILYGQDQNLLKAWHYADLPDAREIARNDFIDSLQGNRNPFIDSVNYVCYIDFDNMSKINGPVIPCSSTNIGVSETKPNLLQLGLWPNPTNGMFTLYLQANESEPVTVRLVDVTGRVVYEQAQAVSPGSNAFALDLRNLAKGVYTLQVAGKTILNEKLVLE